MRTLLFLMLPFLASGQIYIDSYKFGVPLGDQILDLYPNASAAYSLRLLDKDYTGNAVMVRRNNGDSTNIGFVNSYLDTTSLKSFCGTGATDSCAVRVWYDQSGNGYDVRQTTNANQPVIMSAGAIIYNNGDVALDFDGINDRLTRAENFMSSSSAGSMFVAAKFDNATRTSRDIIGGLSDNTGTRFDFMILRQASNASAPLIANAIDLYIEGSIGTTAGDASTYTITNTNTYVFAGIYSSLVRRDVWSNNVKRFSYSVNNLGNLDDGTRFDIGTEIGLSAFLDGKIHELIIWPSDQNSNASGINSNINTFYSIY